MRKRDGSHCFIVSSSLASQVSSLPVGCEGIEPLVIHLACFVTTALQAATRSTTRRQTRGLRLEEDAVAFCSSSKPAASSLKPLYGTGGSGTRRHEGLSFAAQPVGVPCRELSAKYKVRKTKFSKDLSDHFSRFVLCPSSFVLSPQASPAGFEPAIFALTGRRALQAAPRGREEWLVAGG